MLNKQNSEQIGVAFGLIGAMMWGLFPVVVSDGVKDIPPLSFAAISTFLAALGALMYMVGKKRMHELADKRAYFSLFMITLCIVVIPYTLFFWGATMTSGVNASLLLLAEIIFTLFFTPLIGEKNSKLKMAGALSIFFGALFILYNGTLTLNKGDVIIILSTLFYPIGNFYSKKVLNYISPPSILFVRFLFGSFLIYLFARTFEPGVDLITTFQDNIGIILFNGLVLLGVSKIFWYESLRRVDVSKAVNLAMTFPLFSLIALIAFYQEPISVYQWIGAAIMLFGVYLSVKSKSVDPTKTKYAN